MHCKKHLNNRNLLYEWFKTASGQVIKVCLHKKGTTRLDSLFLT